MITTIKLNSHAKITEGGSLLRKLNRSTRT